MKKRNLRTVLIYLGVLALVVWLLANSFGTQLNTQPEELTTGEFVEFATKGLIEEAQYSSSTGGVTGTFWKTETSMKDGDEPLEFTTTWAGADTFTEFAQQNLEGAFTIDNTDHIIWWSLLGSIIPALLIVGVMFFFLNQMQGGNRGVMGFGRAKAKRLTQDKDKITFNDVAGADEAIEELREIKDFLAHPEQFTKMGAKIPKGVLLVGPPGTGKTLLARAVAGEADVPFFTISGSDFVEMFVGVGASRVRDLFEQAKAEAPSIIFMDEIDAVGRHRGAGLGGGHDEREQTLNQLLVEMDGFEGHENVILIAATNRPDILDPALLRPGRFDRQIVVDRPDLKGREEILKIHARNKPLGDDVDLPVLARRTPGFTGADLNNLLNEAALLAARGDKTTISMTELEEGIDRVLAGPERRSRIISDKEKYTIAVHEAGHAIVGHRLPNSDPVHKVTIIPRGRSLGSTWSLPGEDKFLESKKEMIDDIAVLLAGRVAEQMINGDITTGASNDIERATQTAKNMVTKYGMSDLLGPQKYGQEQGEVFLGRDLTNNADYGEATARLIDEEIKRLIDEGSDTALEILDAERDKLELMAAALIEYETLEGEAVDALLTGEWDEYVIKHFDGSAGVPALEPDIEETAAPGIVYAPAEPVNEELLDDLREDVEN
ncbi:MAG: ATP-dependent zinc metalloprotease FtsH [Coriobacteriia bacterium]|nr:ATP-dependent zinc metalloprotease FtsH [Coriobacteriia bacterium]